MKYAAFDVETPNYANDRMSAIGVTVAENGQAKGEFRSPLALGADLARFIRTYDLEHLWTI